MLRRPLIQTARASRHASKPVLWSLPTRWTWTRLASTETARKPRKKKETTVKIELKPVPQGIIEGEPLHNEEAPQDGGWPTVLQQVQNNMRKFSHCVVLTRIGNFYELYFEHATVYGELLGLKQASKKARDTRVAMAGFPYFQLDRYLKILVQDLGKFVAISEERVLDEHERIKFGGLKCDRQVTRVITPGTLIDEHFLSPLEHNYLLAISSSSLQSPAEGREADHVGLAWLDLASGDFVTQSTSLESFPSVIARVGPREVLLDAGMSPATQKHLRRASQVAESAMSVHEATALDTAARTWKDMLEAQRPSDTAQVFSSEENAAASLLLDYVATQLPGLQLRLQMPTRHRSEDLMTIDRNSLRGLEILKTMQDGLFKGSLLHAVRRTSTESGARLLSQRLVSPSASMTEINHRLDLVETLLPDQAFLEYLVTMLRKTSDTFRLVQRVSLGRGDADDLLRLARTIELTRQIGATLTSQAQNLQDRGNSLKDVAQRFIWDGPLMVATRIVEAIDEDSLDQQHQQEADEEAEAMEKTRSVLGPLPRDGDIAQLQKRLSSKPPKRSASNGDDDLGLDDIYIMKRGASPILAQLHDDLDNLRSEKTALAESLRQKLGADSLTLKFTPGLGYICHVRGKDTKVDLTEVERARTVSSSKSTRSFYLPEWTELGRRIDAAKSRIHAEERVTFKQLRDQVIDNLLPLRQNAACLDELDVSASFSRLALELNLKRPILNHGNETKIFSGRHIMVDAGLSEAGRQFTPNDCHIGGSSAGSEHIWLITGPNMAGKSTFLRQTALISILAQTGSFVPAEYAEIGVVDQIFSRVGSADNLSQDQSTFMVEMLETAPILKHATERSFVIMDEVGRGTTPEDGIAVGYAVLEHLRKTNCCRALFATHFHALADMTQTWKEVGAYCTDVKEEADGGFRYDHRLRKGINRESHALKVAQLAGMPDSVIKSAESILQRLREGTDGHH